MSSCSRGKYEVAMQGLLFGKKGKQSGCFYALYMRDDSKKVRNVEPSPITEAERAHRWSIDITHNNAGTTLQVDVLKYR